MKKLFLTMVALVVAIAAGAQSAEKLYTEGKALYDAEKYNEAFPKLKAAAEKGHKKAQYRMGRCYDKGYGVGENDKLAFEWYMKAAKQDHAKSQYRVGKCYKDGEGVKKDRKQAVKWFTKAASQDNADARQPVKDQIQLHQKRCSADHPDIKPADLAQDRHIGILNQRNDHRNHQSERK